MYCLKSHRLHLEFFFSGCSGCRQGALFLGMSQEVQPKRHIIWKQTHARRRQLHPLSKDNTAHGKRKDTMPKVNPQLAVELIYQELKRVEVYTKRIEDATEIDRNSLESAENRLKKVLEDFERQGNRMKNGGYVDKQI